MVMHFWPKCKKCSKMGSECQIFASLRARIIIFSDMKHIIKLKEIPRNGFNSNSKKWVQFKFEEMGSIGAL